MNEIINKFLLAGDKFMPEMHFAEFFDKKSKGSGIKENQQLANELHKPIIKNF